MAEYQPFMIDGVAIPTPHEYGYSEEDLSSERTGRTLDGVMHKDVVAVKDTYPCVWKKLSWEDTALIMNAVHGKTRVKFTHIDPKIPNRFITKDFYIGKRECKLKGLYLKKQWGDINLTFIEI